MRGRSAADGVVVASCQLLLSLAVGVAAEAGGAVRGVADEKGGTLGRDKALLRRGGGGLQEEAAADLLHFLKLQKQKPRSEQELEKESSMLERRTCSALPPLCGKKSRGCSSCPSRGEPLMGVLLQGAA